MDSLLSELLLSCKVGVKSSEFGDSTFLAIFQLLNQTQWHSGKIAGSRVQTQAGRVGVRFLYKLGQPPKTFISYSLLSVAEL